MTDDETRWATNEMAKAIKLGADALKFTRECPGAYHQLQLFQDKLDTPSKLEIEWAERVLLTLAKNFMNIATEVTNGSVSNDPS